VALDVGGQLARELLAVDLAGAGRPAVEL